MENAKDSVKDFRQRGDSSKKNTRSELPGTVPQATTPLDSSRNTSKPSLLSSLRELQFLLVPEALELCHGLDDFNAAVEVQNLQKLMAAIRKIQAVNSDIKTTCSTIESKLFELQDPTWSACKS